MKRRLLATVLSAVMILSCVAFTGSNQAQAAETTGTDPCIYVVVEKDTFERHIDAKTAPTRDGYIFAGWVARKSDGKGVAITSKGDTVLNDTGVQITAKFILAHLTGVACQVKSNTYNEGVESTELRVVSTIDNGTYLGFGFNLYKRLFSSDGTQYRDVLLCEYSAGGENPTQTQDRYTGMYVYSGSEKTVKTPADVFGAAAEGYYFTTARITGIPKRVYDTCIFIIRPYWITADGTYVEGLGEYDRVSDGKNGIVNVTVNLKDAAAIAAGVVKVKYDTANYTFLSSDVGRIFTAMQTANVGGVVNCVGSVTDILNNVEDPNDIFVNLRFQKTGSATGTFTFEVQSNFSNKDEESVTAQVDDVIFHAGENK